MLLELVDKAVEYFFDGAGIVHGAMGVFELDFKIVSNAAELVRAQAKKFACQPQRTQ